MAYHTRLLVTLSMAVLSASGQTPTPAATEQRKYADRLKSSYVSQGGTQAPESELKILGVEAFPCQSEQEDHSARQSCFSARRAYYEYYIAGLGRRTKVYEWNNLSTRVIFVVVLSLVGIGVYFSWKQFFGIMKPRTVTDPPAQAEPGEAPYTELEAGIRGIRVKSPILGVVLLTVSLAFFYLYLVFVYPVTEQF